MSDLDDLYQEQILDHHRSPRNFAVLDGANRKAEGINPLCGDQITVYLFVDGDVIQNISFQGAGCAIAKASASMMTAAVKGKAVAVAAALFKRFHSLVTGQGGDGFDPTELGKLAVFSGVSAFPVRVKCASLAWHTLRAALEGSQQPVSTETEETKGSVP